ncbi:hypothetical protein ACJMK2_040977 [Sinanodonta woodiana]|uniref:Uncharacterized protein n=1 Tax=Sinanodonta woodiana TaxID=1069815 RepID=A0ABD3W3A1_SINWO
MGQMVGVPFKEKKKLKKLTHKWGKSHHPAKRSKKEKTCPNLENASEINGLFECLLQNLDDSSLKNIKETATMLKEIILHMQKIFEEMRESKTMSQGENKKEKGEAGSRNLLQETENETDSRNHEPDHNPRGDCKEDPSTELDQDEASEDPHVREIPPPIVITKNKTNTYSGDVIFVGHNNTFKVNDADPSRELENEDVGKLIERLRKELLFSKMSNRKLKRENGILRRWSANNTDMGVRSVYHNQSDRFSSPRTNSLPPSLRNRHQYTRYAQ